MHRIDTINARPNANGSGKAGYHLNDDLTGVDPTNLDPAALNAIQEEICTIIESQGIGLEKGTNNQLLTAIKKLVFESTWPIGSIYENADDSRNPSHEELLGYGTWVVYGSGKTVVGLDISGVPDTDYDELGETGGSKSHTLTVNQLPSFTVHIPNITPETTAFNAGGGSEHRTNAAGDPSGIDSEPIGNDEAFSIIDPYVVAARWKRTA